METMKTSTAINWNRVNSTKTTSTGFWTNYINFLDQQQARKTQWFLISLAIHATFILPLPLVLIGFFNAPIIFLGITMACFFINFVANMGGSGIRVTLSCFFGSLAIHLGMIIWTMLT